MSTETKCCGHRQAMLTASRGPKRPSAACPHPDSRHLRSNTERGPSVVLATNFVITCYGSNRKLTYSYKRHKMPFYIILFLFSLLSLLRCFSRGEVSTETNKPHISDHIRSKCRLKNSQHVKWFIVGLSTKYSCQTGKYPKLWEDQFPLITKSFPLSYQTFTWGRKQVLAVTDSATYLAFKGKLTLYDLERKGHANWCQYFHQGWASTPCPMLSFASTPDPRENPGSGPGPAGRRPPSLHT